MKVLFLSQIVPYPPHGGVLQRGYNLLRELGRDARVHLLAFVHPDVLPTEAACRESLEALQKFCETVKYSTSTPLGTIAVRRPGTRSMSVCSSGCETNRLRSNLGAIAAS